MTKHIAPFLMFQGQAEAALTYYIQVFGSGQIVSMERWPEGAPNVEPGTVKTAVAEVAGLTIMASDNAVDHGFTFTPSLSLFATMESEDEIKRVCATLLDGGEALMPLGDYGFSKQFAWVKDRYGVSWQLNLP